MVGHVAGFAVVFAGCLAAPAVPAPGATGQPLVITASDRALIDEEYPQLVRNHRLHILDDAKACGGFGSVRSIARWDVSNVDCADIAAVHARWTYAHDFEQYSGGSRQVAVHQLSSAWSQNSATWSNAPTFDPVPLAVFTLHDVPDASIVLPVSLDAGVNGLMIKFTDETCAPPRWPAELALNPTLEVECL